MYNNAITVIWHQSLVYLCEWIGNKCFFSLSSKIPDIVIITIIYASASTGTLKDDTWVSHRIGMGFQIKNVSSMILIHDNYLQCYSMKIGGNIMMWTKGQHALISCLRHHTHPKIFTLWMSNTTFSQESSCIQ